ncbi:adenylate cyclase [Schistosoma japonicum]|nr:adenylate cyclase [Schistosoma japonicum]
MTDSKEKSLKFSVIPLLVIMAVTLYVAVELNLFISDQYVFYSAVTKHGLPYFTRKEGQRYENLSDDDKHKLKLAQKESATLEAVSNSVRITLGLITTLLMGYLSDRYGRRVVFGILLLGETFHIGITSLIVLLKLNLWMILLPGFLEAVFGGGLLSIFAQVAAIVVDICQAPTIESGNEKCIKTKQSSDRYLWTLFTLFDGIAGALIYNYGFPVATCTSLALLVPSLILVFFLPETNRNRGKRTDVQEKEPRTHTGHPDENSRSIPTEFVKTLKNRMTKGFKRLKSLDPVLIIIMSLVLFGSIGALSDLQYVAVYLMGPPFLWNPEAVGLYSGITDVTAALISVTCTIVIIKFHAKKRSKVQNNVKNQKNEKHYTRQMNLLVTVFAVAMVMLIINCSMVGMAHQFSLPTANILIYIAAVPRLMKSFCVPLIRTMFSICTHPSKQGFMQSVAAFVSRIGLLISFTALPAIYAATVLTFPGTVFIVVVIILMITLIIDLFVPLVVKKGNVDVKADEFNGIYSVQEEEKLDNILNFCGDTF